MKVIVAISFVFALIVAATPAKAFDYSFSDQSYTDQNNNQDNCADIDNVETGCQ